MATPSLAPAAAIVPPTSTTGSLPSNWLRIIQINDVYELDNFPRLYNLIRDYRHHHHHRDDHEPKSPATATAVDVPNETLIICAGDFLAPSLLSSLDQGAAMVDCFNALGVTHVCFGNHEADIPFTALANRIRQSNFCWINTNMPALLDKLAATSSSTEDPPLASSMPEYCMIPVQSSSTQLTKHVCLLGLLTSDPSLYRPGAFGDAAITPIPEAAMKILQQFHPNDEAFIETGLLPSSSSLPQSLDLIVPLTHQSIGEDRNFCQRFGGHVFPVVCGGHDHEIYNEIVNGSQIVKAGMDATHAAIIDFKWYDTDAAKSNNAKKNPPTVQVTLVPVSEYNPHPGILRRIQGHQKVLQELERARMFRIADWMSTTCKYHLRNVTAVRCEDLDNNNDDDVEYPVDPRDKLSPNGVPPKSLSSSLQASQDQQGAHLLHFSTANNRLGPSTGTTAICTMLRMGMRAQCALINAGAVRGGNVYPSGVYFTWSDLKAEIPFETRLTACFIPGRVLQAAIRHSRMQSLQDPPTASGGYLHTCSNILFCNNDDQIMAIHGRPFVADELYLTALPAQFFAGIDNHLPLLEWAAEQLDGAGAECAAERFSEESAIPAKMVLVQVFAASMWLQMGSFDEIDRDHDGVIRRDEVKARLTQIHDDEGVADLIVDNIFSIADMNRDGTISPLEMMICQFVATDIIDHVCTQDELNIMKEVAAQVLGKDPSHAQVKSMVEQIRDSMDLGGDGKITRNEVMQALGSLERSELLR